MKLSPRQIQILELIGEGHKIASAAAILKCSPFTVNHQLRRAYLRLGVHSAAAAIAKGLTGGERQLYLSLP